MIKKIQFLFCVLFGAFVFNSCFYIVADRPYYYSDYEDPETSASYNYYYSYSYTNYAAVPTFTPTPVTIKQTNIYIILKVIDNRHIFYRNNREIAVWFFLPDGRIERKGENINGKVIRYYDNSDIIEWEFEYKNNLRWGHCRRYFYNGKIWEEVYYNKGKREGPYKIYHPNGKIKEEVKYKDGFRDGIYREYNEDGKLIERGNYKSNRKEVKFRDEKYFEDKKNEIIPSPTLQMKVQSTPTTAPTIDMKQHEDKGLKIYQVTPEIKHKYGDKDEDKDINKYEDKYEEKGEIKDMKQGQEIIEKKVDVEQLTTNVQAEQKFLKMKKQKDKKQYKKYFRTDEKTKDKDVDEEEVYSDVTVGAKDNADKDDGADKDKKSNLKDSYKKEKKYDKRDE